MFCSCEGDSWVTVDWDLDTLGATWEVGFPLYGFPADAGAYTHLTSSSLNPDTSRLPQTSGFDLPCTGSGIFAKLGLEFPALSLCRILSHARDPGESHPTNYSLSFQAGFGVVQVASTCFDAMLEFSALF